MTIIDIDEDDIVKFKEVSDSPSSGVESDSVNILDSVRNTGSSEVRFSYFDYIQQYNLETKQR